jgi:hypothetical protein
MTRARVISGEREYAIACGALAAVVKRQEWRMLTAIERDRGHYVYPVLNGRISDSAKFTENLLTVVKGLEIPVENEAQFKEKMKEFVDAEKLPVKDVDEFVPGLLKGLADNAKVGPGLDKVQQTLLERELYRLFDPRETGFVGRYQEAVKRIQDIAVLKDREFRLKEVTHQEGERKKLLDAREKHSTATFSKLLAARDETRRLASDLARLQDQLFRAQLELADVEARNQAMERRIRALEKQKLKQQGGKK